MTESQTVSPIVPEEIRFVASPAEASCSVMLSSAEREELVGILDNYISDLRVEITNTDFSEYKHMLRDRKAVLVEVLDKLRAAG